MVTEKRSLGWINRGPASSAGELTSAETILHTGFTGTNIWVDRKNEVAFVLLSNRVHPTRKNILHMFGVFLPVGRQMHKCLSF